MSGTLRAGLVRGCLRVARLPSLPPVVAGAEMEDTFGVTADALLAGGDVAIPEPRLDFLRWLAVNRPVAFHGSPRADLRELSTERQSRDATPWGDQQAVYASTDPVWAIYLLSPAGFVADMPLADATDTAHLVSHTPVTPLARVDVTPADFPFRDRVRYYRDREPIWVSVLRAGRR
jgi:hypothetical protein